jgi:hypothetical protein
MDNVLTWFSLKTRDRFEQDCLRIKGYLAQGHMVMGQEERKNKAKLEKTQIQLASNSNEYEAAVKTLEETTGRWNKEWKAACDVCDAFWMGNSKVLTLILLRRNSKTWKKSASTLQRAAFGLTQTSPPPSA